MEIPIKYKGIIYTVLIDDEDWNLVKDYKWRIIKNANTHYCLGYKYQGYKNYAIVLMNKN